MTDENTNSIEQDRPPEPGMLEEDRQELALVGRITVLEEWRDRAEPALGLALIAVLSMAAAGFLLTLALRKRLR